MPEPKRPEPKQSPSKRQKREEQSEEADYTIKRYYYCYEQGHTAGNCPTMHNDAAGLGKPLPEAAKQQNLSLMFCRLYMGASKSSGHASKMEEWHGWGSQMESRCWLQWQKTNRAIAQGDYEEGEAMGKAEKAQGSLRGPLRKPSLCRRSFHFARPRVQNDEGGGSRIRQRQDGRGRSGGTPKD